MVASKSVRMWGASGGWEYLERVNYEGMRGLGGRVSSLAGREKTSSERIEGNIVDRE